MVPMSFNCDVSRKKHAKPGAATTSSDEELEASSSSEA